MTTLVEVFPDPDTLLRSSVPDVAPVILRLARDFRPHPNIVHVQDIMAQVHGPPPHDKGYPQQAKPHAERKINEAWQWLKRQGLLIPEPDPNGGNGWHHLSEEAEAIARGANIRAFMDAASFPRELLHAAIAEDVWQEIARGDYDDAVLKSMRAVEEAVRAAGGFGANDLGVDLMRRAFNPQNGRLSDAAEPAGERDGLMQLFAGAIGYYKNPQSHRTVKIDGKTAREVAVLASNLLRIVDARKAGRHDG